MRRIIMLLCLGHVAISLFGQNDISIAVVTSGKEVSSSVLHLIEDDFQSELLNASEAKFDVRIGKSDEFFKERNVELDFQHSGVVAESMVKEYGKMMEVEQLCVIVVEKRQSQEGQEDYYIRAKIFDVETGKLSKTASYPDLLEGDEPIYNIYDQSTLQRANKYLICRFQILDSVRQDNLLKKIDKLKKSDEKRRKRPIRKENSKAFAASLIPGVGLIKYKNRVGEGAIYLVGDIVLVGAGVGSLFYAKKQRLIMESRETHYDEYLTAKTNYGIANTVSYVCFGSAALVYGVNLIRSYVAPLKETDRTFTILPAFTGSNITSENYIGLSLTYRF